MDFALGIYLWFTHPVTFKEWSKSCISQVCRRMGLDQTAVQETAFVVGTLEPDVEVVPGFQVRAGACCTTLRCLWKCVLLRISVGLVVPVWHLCSMMEAIEARFGTSLWEGRASSVRITRAPRQHAGSVLVWLLAGGERLVTSRGEGTRWDHPRALKELERVAAGPFPRIRAEGAGGASVGPSASRAGGGGGWCWPRRAPCVAGHGGDAASPGGTAGGTARCCYRDPEDATRARVVLGRPWFLGSEWPLLGPARGRRRKDQGLRCRRLLPPGPFFCLLQNLEAANQPKKRRRKDYLMVKMIECCLGKLIVFPSFATFSPLWCWLIHFNLTFHRLLLIGYSSVSSWFIWDAGLWICTQLLLKTILDT